MEPIGLTCKNDGELMVVHLCLSCGRASPNRIAGDDNTYALLKLLGCRNASNATKHPELLTKNDMQQVQTALFGYST